MPSPGRTRMRMPAPLRCRSAAVLGGDRMRLAGRFERAGGIRGGVNPEDLHAPRGGQVAEAVGHVGRNESRVEGLQAMLLPVDVDRGFALEEDHALLAVVAMKRHGGAGSELRDSGYETARAERGRDQRRRQDASGALVGLHFGKPKQDGGAWRLWRT